MTAINRGIPISEVEKSDSMHQNFLDMAANISGVLHPRNTGMQRQGGRQSLLKSLFGKK
jgi:hypothetical protein